MIRATAKDPRPIGEKVAAAVFVVAGLVLFFVVPVDYALGLRQEVTKLSHDRGSILPEKRAAYEWLTRATDRDARVIACEDSSLYLYSERAAIRALTADGIHTYRHARIGPEVTDVARAIGAEYWLVSTDDDDPDWTDSGGEGRPKNIGDVPLVFKSEHGRVRVYWLGCGEHPQDSRCGSAQSRILLNRKDVLSQLYSDRKGHE